MDDIRKVLKPRDRSTLDATVGQSWVPKDPAELILPYIEKDPPSVESDLDKRRRKAKEVYDGYGQLIEECKTLEETIADSCKEATVTLNPASESTIIDAVRRVFGTDGTQITFEMYKIAVEKLMEINKPSLGGI